MGHTGPSDSPNSLGKEVSGLKGVGRNGGAIGEKESFNSPNSLGRRAQDWRGNGGTTGEKESFNSPNSLGMAT